MMKFEDGPYYIGGKNRVDEMWACINEVVLNYMNFNVMVSGITIEVRCYMPSYFTSDAAKHNIKILII